MKDNKPAASYDVAILGGGPAGAATALALRRRDAGLRVVLIEQSDYAALRVGETLPPPAQRLLAELGVWAGFLRRAPLESYGTRAAWGRSDLLENSFIFSPYGRGWHLDRRDFDAWLVAEAEHAGADVFRRTVARVHDRRGGAWNLVLHEADRPDRELRAGFVVDATGRRSAFARTRGARHLVFDQLVGAVVFFRFDSDDAQPDSYTAVEACRDGWWYTAPLPNGLMAAIFMTDANHLRSVACRTLQQWRALSAAAPYTAGRVARGQAIAEPSLRLAASQRLDACAGDGWIAVGDAACTVDPLSSQGVMRALRSGITAAHVISQHRSGNSQALTACSARLAKGYGAYLETRAAYYAEEQRWPDAPFWRCRHHTVTRGGTAYAVHLANQHQEESEAGGARDL